MDRLKTAVGQNLRQLNAEGFGYGSRGVTPGIKSCRMHHGGRCNSRNVFRRWKVKEASSMRQTGRHHGLVGYVSSGTQ